MDLLNDLLLNGVLCYLPLCILLVIGAGLWSASLGLAFNPIDHASHYSVWFPLDSNPRPGFSALSGISEWSAGVRVSMGAGHVMAYAAIGLR